MKTIRIVVLLLFSCLTDAAIGQQLPAGLALPPHWDKLYEVISYDNGALTYRDKATGLTNTLFITAPEHKSVLLDFVERDTLPVPPLDTLYADTVLSIEVWNVDTSFYAPRFTLLGEIPIFNIFTHPLVIYDFNQNGINDMLGYGMSYEPGNSGTFNWFYEWQPDYSTTPGGWFEKVFEYTQTVDLKGGAPLGAVDIDDDGRHEAYFGVGTELRFYEADTVNGYPDTLVYTIQLNYPNHPASALSYDFDSDGKIEFHFAQPLPNNNFVTHHSALWECQSGSNQLQKTWWRNVKSVSAGATVVGNMDNDGYNEFYFSGWSTTSINPRYRIMHGFENEADNRFNYYWRASLPVVNSGRSALPGDMDGDGLPEILFQGGSYTVEGKYLLTFIESSGPDSLIPTASILIKTGTGFLGGNGSAHGDVDGDGVHELAIELGGWTLLFAGVGNNNYELFWIKKHGISDSHVSMGDVDGDNRSELIISGLQWDPITQRSYPRSLIYKFNGQTGITPPVTTQQVSASAQLLPSFPSPFNHATTIKYQVNKPGEYRLSVFDLNGKEVQRLADRFHVQGNYQLIWNANSKTGKEASSGIYFVVLQSEKFFQVCKTVYVK